MDDWWELIKLAGMIALILILGGWVGPRLGLRGT